MSGVRMKATKQSHIEASKMTNITRAIGPRILLWSKRSGRAGIDGFDSIASSHAIVIRILRPSFLSIR